jgi:UDP-glucose 4-epimerase
MVEIMNGADTVFLLAAKARVQPSIEEPVEYEMNNTIGTLNVLKCASDAGVRRVVYSASSSAYGNTDKLPSVESDPVNPMSPYGAQKYYGEVMCKMFSEVYGLETVSLRYFNIYGERQNVGGAYAMVIGIFADQRLNDKPMTIRGDGEQRRDFTYVGDVVNANILASQSEKVGKGEVINIGNGDNRSINEIAAMIGGPTEEVEPVIEPKETLADNSLARELLGWKPTGNVEKWISEYRKVIGLSDDENNIWGYDTGGES